MAVKTSGNNEKDYGTTGKIGFWDDVTADKKGVTYKKSADLSKNADGTSKTGINKSLGDIGNWLTDIGRNASNFVGGASSWLHGRDPVVNGGLGDLTFGRAWTQDEKLGSSTPGATGSRPGMTADTLDHYLTGSGSTTPPELDAYQKYGELLKSLGATNDAHLGQLFGSAADYIRGMQGDVSGIYDKAAEGYKAGKDAATNTVNAGYGVARAQQAAALKALGIEEGAGAVLGENSGMSKDQTAANTRLADILASNLDKNTATQASALQSLLAQAAGYQAEGARSREMYQQALAKQIAQNEMARMNYIQQGEIAANKQKSYDNMVNTRWGSGTPISASDYQANQDALMQYYTGKGLSSKDAASATAKDMQNYMQGKTIQ